ncbi:glycosyltransferase [Sabulilitoribacter multivorans]|uniref:Glycosyltransferase n=1 Tax=Flaviramulus multivorans TaxID=1304750 RepID=A0ABS9IHJ8_9FLAO|nr:glycosyltransferase [Flaviramulus multivorans]MCF7560043.1 glycosyltransferase [Flaviramulus multivorans]
MRLSIIIPLYNVEKYVSTCLDSILNQGLNEKEYEILIINDGSTDNSLEIVENFEQKYSHIHVYSKKNGGVGSARNKGIDLAKGQYIYFIDPDDYLADNVLEIILYYAEKNNLQILAFSSLGTTKTDINKSQTSNAKSLPIQIFNGREYIASFSFKNEIWWYIINRDFLNEIPLRFIEDRWMEDAIFTGNILLKAERISKLDIDAHRHVKVEGSAMTSKEPSHYLKVINDNANAALMYKPLIEGLEKNEENKVCIERLKARQQSFVFFLMIRMLKSTIKFDKVKKTITNMNNIGAYPLNAFIGKDYNGFVYTLLVKLFNIKRIYYMLFLISNPILKLKR